MKNTIDILKGDSIKSTLYGKFYEKIIIGWLKHKEKFSPFDGKPRVYWNDIEYIKNDNKVASNCSATLKSRHFYGV